MTMPRTLFVLFLALSLSGCIGEPLDAEQTTTESQEEEKPEEAPGFLKPEPEKSLAYPKLNVTFEVQNEVKIIRFITDYDEGIQTSLEVEHDDVWDWGIFVHGGGHVYDSKWSGEIRLRANEHNATVPIDGNPESWGEKTPGPNRPGTHDIVLYAERDTRLSVQFTSPSATYEVLQNETASVRWITQHHPDWDRDTHIDSPAMTIFEGSIEITPKLNSMDITGIMFGLERRMTLDVDPNLNCHIRQSGAIGAYTDEPVTVSAKTKNVLAPHTSVNLLVIDWSLDLKEKKCWDPS